MSEEKNLITKMDYPDPDVICVDGIYYMVSTTMHFFPGGEILRSYDLLHWEHLSYIFDTLDGTPEQKLEQGDVYGKGMWAACLRYHKGMFYVSFAANDTQKTYLYTANDIMGPWEKHYIDGFYHDNSILFDDDGRIYLASGNRNIRIVELKEDLSGPLEGGFDRIVVSDEGNPMLGYEGSHFYKINGCYYLFLIHSLADRWMRAQACFVSDDLNGEFVGGDIWVDDNGYCGQGVAQGGIVQSPCGDWYTVLFQDRGAIGRIPILLSVTWKHDCEVSKMIGPNNRESVKIPYLYPVVQTIDKILQSVVEDENIMPLTQSDNFKNDTLYEDAQHCRKQLYGSFGLKSAWQFNHEPKEQDFCLDMEHGRWIVACNTQCENVLQAPNMITQRMRFPYCAAMVTIDASDLKEGGVAGLCALQGCYGMIAVTKVDGKYYIVMRTREEMGCELDAKNGKIKEKQWERIELEKAIVRVRLEADFWQQKDEICFSYEQDKTWISLGPKHKVKFGLDHFTGCRFGLFAYASNAVGGKAAFSDFAYEL